ncbi:MAG: dephospho-CoA kinase [Candidatus Eiseniibacteriota bacterium]
MSGARARREQPHAGPTVVGVTGGVASGKSTFVRILAGGGESVVLDGDRMGHEVLERPEIKHALAKEFGFEIIDDAGEVQRSVLGPLAFASPDSLAALNAIVHPPLLALVWQRLNLHEDESFDSLVILDAALLVEWDIGAWCDVVVAVLASPASQVERLVRDRGRTEEEARDIVARQLPNEARAAYADFVIENDGTPAELEARSRVLADRLWRDTRSRTHPSRSPQSPDSA